MNTLPSRSAPYAPAANVLLVIEKARNGRVPNPVSPFELERMGVPAGNTGRTFLALRQLGLLSDDGEQTEALARLRRAPTDEYQQVLADILREAYDAVFAVLDVEAQPSYDQITDAFRGMTPEGQRERMVALFVGLCREAGLLAKPNDEGRKSSLQRRRRSASASRPVRPSRNTAKLQTLPLFDYSDSTATVPPIQSSSRPITGDYAWCAWLLDQVPSGPHPSWSDSERDRWLTAFTAALDYRVLHVADKERPTTADSPDIDDVPF